MANQKPKPGKVIQKPKNQQRQWIIGATLLASLLFIFYLPTLKYEFVNWDDDANVYENQNVKNFDIEGIFTNHVIGNYNPLTTLTFALEYKVVKDKAALYHFNNMLLHVLCTLLVLVLMRQLGMSMFVSFFVALLFGIHPMRVESVAWVTERKDVLFGAFYLVSLLLYISYYKTKKVLYLLLSLLVFALSLLSKIQAVALPFSIILIDYWFSGKISIKSVLAKTPYFVLSFLTGVVGIYFLKQQGSLEVGVSLPILQRLFIGSYSYLVYIIKSVVPFQLVAIYPYPAKLNVIFYLSMIPALALVIYAIATWRKKRFFTFGLLFFTANIMFLLQVVGAGQGFLADRFSYIPYIGLFFVYAVFTENAMKRFGHYKAAIYGLVAVYVVSMAAVTLKQIKVWENNETLWTDVIEKNPRIALAYNNLGHYYRQQNEYDKAVENYNKGIKLEPNKAMTYNNRGTIYFNRGQYDPALEDFNKCLSIDPNFLNALANRGSVFGIKKEYDKALGDLNRALQIDPKHANALSNRGFVYFQLGQYEKTIADYTAFLLDNPNDADVINTLGLCYSNLKEYDKALVEYDKSIRIKPNLGAFYMNRSYTFNSKNDKANALNDALKAQELGYKVNVDYLNFLKTLNK